MIFHLWKQMISDNPPWQHRVLVKPKDYVPLYVNGSPVAVCTIYQGRTKFRVGETIAIQPPTGSRKAIGRTPPLKAIRRERLGEISYEDALAEGIFLLREQWGYTYTWPGRELEGPHYFGQPQYAYADLWNHTGGDWEKDKEKDVWVLEFEKPYKLDASHAFAVEVEQSGEPL
jgi:hypothetical protein